MRAKCRIVWGYRLVRCYCLYHLVSRSLVHGERRTLHICFLCRKAVMRFKGGESP